MFENQNAQQENIAKAYAVDQARAMQNSGPSAHGHLNTAAVPPSQSSDLIERIAQRLQALQSLKTRVGLVADRLTGSVPQDAGGGKVSPGQPVTVTAKLGVIDDYLIGLEQDLRNNVERLEQFV